MSDISYTDHRAAGSSSECTSLKDYGLQLSAIAAEFNLPEVAKVDLFNLIVRAYNQR